MAVLEKHAVAEQLGDVAPARDPAVADIGQKVLADAGVLRQIGWAGLGTPTRSWSPTAEVDQPAHDAAHPRRRQLKVRARKAAPAAADAHDVLRQTTQAPRRVDRVTLFALRQRSTAMSTAELPMPTTSTRLPSYAPGVR